MFDLAPYYPHIKTLHLAAVGVSLVLFAVRWLAVLAQATWPMRVSWRITSVAIDSVLLGAGVMLWLSGGWVLAASPWLWVKWGLLVVYVLLGTWALKRARSWLGHLGFGLAALAVAAQMVGVGWMHHPAGWWAWLMAYSPSGG